MLTRRIRHLLLILPLLWASGPSRANGTLSSDRARAVDQAVKDEMVRQNLVGAAVGIVENGHVAYLQGYGWQDREARIPASVHTMFRWASISKPVCAVAAMQLVEKGKLNLDADVRSYVPEFPDKGKVVTVRETLDHQSGLPFYSRTEVVPRVRSYDVPHPFMDVLTAVDTFALSPLLFDPGTQYHYTTYGYILASAIVQRAGKQPYAQQVKQRIADPFQMTTFQPDYQWKDIPNRAVGYRRNHGVVVRSSNTDVSWKLGGGGYISTIGDLARFANGLLNGHLVKPATEAAMWTPQPLKNGKKTTYGLGFEVRTDAEGKRTVSHGGSQEKVRSMMWLRPDENRAVVVFSNCEYANVGALRSAVSKAAFGE